METKAETKPSGDRTKTLQPQEMQSRSFTVVWRTKQLLGLAEVYREPLTKECVTIYLESLSDLNDDQFQCAVGRAINELEWFPKPAQLRALAGMHPRGQTDAEARAAWDVLMAFVRKYVGNDVYGNYGPEHGWHPKTYPKLNNRILDTVRRTGGWQTYKRMTDESFPFIQKRFSDEYKAWTEVERVPPTSLLEEVQTKRLASPPTDQVLQETAPRSVQSATVVPKRFPQPMTEAELRDRREMLRQQVEIVRAKKRGEFHQR